jgi:aminopeptidase N
MLRFTPLLAGLAFIGGCYTALPPAPPPPAAVAMWEDVSYLGDPARIGRQLGSPGRDSAALYIARRFAEAGLEPAIQGECSAGPPCKPGFGQDFSVRSPIASGTGVNVLALVPGTDPARAGRAIVVGAHYDHVGRLASLALDPQSPGIRPGADDNASGTAAMLELARRLARRPAPRPVLFIAFDAEELGLIGSEHFIDQPVVPLDSVVAMLNLDMVGRLRSSRLIVRGTASDPRWKGVLERANTRGLVLQLRSSGGNSDHMPFLRAGVPAVHFFTGLHPDYHTRGDIVEGLNVPGMLRVVNLVEAVVRELAAGW